MTPAKLEAILKLASADILADLPHLTEMEMLGVYLFLARIAGA